MAHLHAAKRGKAKLSVGIQFENHTLVFHHIPCSGVTPKHLCALARPGCTHDALFSLDQ